MVLPLAQIGILSARQCALILAPVAALLVVRAVLKGVDHAVEHLFPGLAWHRQLGWLNIRSERRAAAILRGLSYAVYAVLALALYGIIWSAQGLRQLDQWSDPMITGGLAVRVPILAVCLGLWLFYLGLDVYPRARREFEDEELERFRAEQAELERERENRPAPRGMPAPQIWSKSPPVPGPRAGR
jgi:hypothetical protein